MCSGIFGVKPPTKDLNVTLALAVMSMFLIEYCGIHKKGLKGFFKSFLDPIPVMLPMNIMESSFVPLPSVSDFLVIFSEGL